MKICEFIEQDDYCRKNNTPEGPGCTGCPGEHDKVCADKIRRVGDNGG